MKGWSWLFGAVLILVGLVVIYVTVVAVLLPEAWCNFRLQGALDVIVAGVVLIIGGLSLIILSKS